MYLVVHRAAYREFKGLRTRYKSGPSHNMMTALIKDLTVLLEYIDLLGAPAKWGLGQNTPVALTPPIGCPALVHIPFSLCI